MKLINRDTDYAIRALLYMAQKPERLVSVQELVDEAGVPKAFLRRILQQLGKAGILKSIKGKGGGFTLAVSARRIRLSKVIEILQGKVSFNKCVLKKKICPNKKTCPLRKKILKIEKNVVEELQVVTIASLIEGD